MADIKQIQVGNTNYNISGAMIVLEDNNTTTNGVWLAKTNQITSLIDGQLFLYKTVKGLNTSTMEATLTITANGQSLGSKSVVGPLYKEIANSKLTNNFNEGEYILLVYNATETVFQVINSTPSYLGNISKIYHRKSSIPYIYFPEDRIELAIDPSNFNFKMQEDSFKFRLPSGNVRFMGWDGSTDSVYIYLHKNNGRYMDIHVTKTYSDKLKLQGPNARVHIGEIDGTKIFIRHNDSYNEDFYIKAISNGDYEGLYLNRPIYIGDPNGDGNDSTAQRALVESDIEEISEEVGKNLKVYTNEWEVKTWSGLSSFGGYDVWTDGDNIYYSDQSTQKILNKSTSTWSNKTWSGLTNFSGYDVWTDGDNIYYSWGSSQYVLNKTTSTWLNKTWIGLTNFSGDYIWTDGDNIYYSSGSEQYVLNKSTSTWTTKTWGGYAYVKGDYIWTDGDNVYYSEPIEPGDNPQYVLDKSTSTWIEKNWPGISANELQGNAIWTDGINIYYSNYSDQKILDKSTSTWSAKTWSGLTNFSGYFIWTDGNNIYYSSRTVQYQLNSMPLKDKLTELNDEYSELVSISNGVLELN